MKTTAMKLVEEAADILDEDGLTDEVMKKIDEAMVAYKNKSKYEILEGVVNNEQK